MTFQERYSYNPETDLLGRGGFARVYKAKDILLDREVAIKVFNASEKGKYTVIDEIKKAIKLEHPNLLRYYDVAIVENTNALGEKEVIQIGVMELANAGDLKQFAKNNPNSSLLPDLLQQVLSGLGYLHQRGIVHRDLKPQNILLINQDGKLTAKISDFGISKDLESNSSSSSMAIGTIEYMAPEQFNPSKYGINGKIDTNVDLWSFGIMVFELITNQILFGQRNGNTTAEQIMNAILSPEMPKEIDMLSEPYKTIVKNCLINDANLRAKKANEIINYFNSSPNIVDNYSSAETVAFKIPDVKNEYENNNENILKPDSNKNYKKDLITNNHKNFPSKLLLTIGLFSFLIIAAYFSFFYKKGQSISSFSAVDSAKTLINQKKYKEAIVLLTDAVTKPGADKVKDTYLKALPLYAFALLESSDTVNAIPFIEKSAELNDVESIYQLGSLYYVGKFKKTDFKKARMLFEKAANLKDARAEVMLGNIYFMGEGVEIDYSKAIIYYSSAAEKGNSIATYAIGIAYLNGAGVVQDNAEAKKWFQKVLDLNNDSEAIEASKQQLKNL